MKNVVVKTTYKDLVPNGWVTINEKGKVIINKKYFNSLTHRYQIGFGCKVKALERALMRERILSKSFVGNNHVLPPNVVVDKNNNVIDPNTVSKKVYGTYKAHMKIRAKKAGTFQENVVGSNYVLLPNVVVDKNNNVVDPTTMSKRRYGSFKAQMTRRAKKAGLLPKINGTSQPKNYNRPKKRAFVKRFTDLCSEYGNGEVLALESSAFLCAKALPDHDFTIYERDTGVMKEMRINRKNISNIRDLVKGDIAKVPYRHFDYAFPDFCDTYKTNEHRIKLLSKRLHDTKFIAFTFAFRGHGFTKDEGEPMYVTMKNLESIFKNHVISYHESYNDGSAMYGIILRRKGLE